MGCCESCTRDQSKTPSKKHYELVVDQDGSTTSKPQEIVGRSEEFVQEKSSKSDNSKHTNVSEGSYGSVTDSMTISPKKVLTTSEFINVTPKKETPQKSNFEPASAQVPTSAQKPEEPVEIINVTPKKSQKATESFAPQAAGLVTPIAPVPRETISPVQQLDRNSIYSRELRLFLPHPDDIKDLSWLSRDQIHAYKESLQVFTLLALEGNNTPEVREDTYLVGQNYFGLKYRNQSKLELKVRTETRPAFLEKWSKVKFGKKKLATYKPDILTYLSDVGYASDHVANNAILEEPQFISIFKSRNSIVKDKLSIEVCEITIPEKQNKFGSPVATNKKGPAAAALAATDPDQIHRKRWLTVAIEGSIQDIETFILHHHKHSELFKCLELLKQIHTNHTADALNHSFLPVVSGYPQWVRLLANQIKSETVDQELMVSVNALLTFVK